MGSVSSLSKVSAVRRSSRVFVKHCSFLRKFSIAAEQATEPQDKVGYASRYDPQGIGFRQDSESDSRGGHREGSGNALGNWGSSPGWGGNRPPVVDTRYCRGVDTAPRDDGGFVRRVGDDNYSVNSERRAGEFPGNASGMSGVYYDNGGWSPRFDKVPETTSRIEVSQRGHSPRGMSLEVDGKDASTVNTVSPLGSSNSVAPSWQSASAFESILTEQSVGHNTLTVTSARGSQEKGAPSHPVEEEPNKDSDGAPLVGTLEELDALCSDGKVKQAVEVLTLLANKCVAVDLPRFVHLMKMCGDKRALQEAKNVHEHVTRTMSPISVYMCNRILEMYAGCGSVDSARAVFDSMAERNLSTWDIMITCLAQNGHGEDAIDLFTEFKQAGLKPDGQLFIALFSACAAVGDVFEGMLHFESMQKDFGIMPAMDHYMSVVKMLGTVGHLDEALEFVENLPIEPGIEIWEVLMNLCRIHGYTDMGEKCSDMVDLLDSSYLTQHSRSGLLPLNQEAVDNGEQQQWKLRGVCEYRAGDRSHPETENIYALLRGLKELMKEAGYIPNTKFVLHDVDQESREEAIQAHSERLAVSHGVMTTAERSTVRIIKNLRVCGDCHNVFKFISKITGREIIMRDAKRFHHFKDGECTCKDFW
ncbi:hypothetical protein MLD38_014095 [Melastoma candidum]|uniref:Uncharacterized protein n=1 Tax=Melastoma candidum TaxID=119954 RepID=A0ACB9RDI8_9MYRT|nr:hypothetical protein MLD38_014095 [Melastoma candidum]